MEESSLQTVTPKLLYRFLSWENGTDLLSTKQLKLSTVNFYNDPFEFCPASKYTDRLSRMTKEELKKYIEDNLKEYNSMPSFIEMGALSLASYSGMATALSFGALLPIAAAIGAASILVQRSRTNNAEELKRLRHFVETYLDFINSIKTCCFSETLDNILMWSHYADKHKGIAIAFKTSTLYWKEELFRKIKYSDTRVRIPLEEGDSSTFINELITTKAKCWEYEKEWRIIKYDAQNINSLSFDESFIDCIYIGLKVPDASCKEIVHLRDTSLKGVKIKRAYMDDDRFELQFKDV